MAVGASECTEMYSGSFRLSRAKSLTLQISNTALLWLQHHRPMHGSKHIMLSRCAETHFLACVALNSMVCLVLGRLATIASIVPMNPKSRHRSASSSTRERRLLHSNPGVLSI